MLLDFFTWLETTTVSTLVRESLYGFQILVAIHLMGLTLSVGMLVWFDLRLLGVIMRTAKVSDVYRRLAPWLLSGFAVMFVSGGLLFIGFAVAAYADLYFQIKLAAMLVAGLNALYFHFVTERGIAGWDAAPQPPLSARVAGLTSIVMWAVVILMGRILPYSIF